MSVAGKVAIGFSEPWVAKYGVTGGALAYSNAMKLARGVSVDVSPEVAEDGRFDADNVAAERAGNIFVGGTLSLTVDGLFQAAERFIQGLPTADSDGFVAYNDDQSTGYFGVGFIVKYRSEGADIFTPMILAKVSFDPIKTAAETQGESIDWQTQEITAKLMRADDTKHTWKFVGTDYDTEAEALGALKTKLGVTTG